MKSKVEDEGIRAVRDVRSKISAECANDPKRLVEHYVVEQNGTGEGCFALLPSNKASQRTTHRIAADH